MKIAFLNIYHGIVERGSEVFVENLSQKLAQNHTVRVFHQDINTPIRKSQDFLYDLSVFLFTLSSLPQLWKEKFDWIIPINGRLQVLLVRILRFFRGGKILISGHAGVGAEDKWNILIGKPDIFVALSPTASAWAKKINSRTKYIPNGVDIENFSPNGRKATIPLKKPIVLVTSALLPYKRVELTIEAVSELKNTSLLVIGDGPLKNKIENLGNNKLQNRFLLIPKVSYREIPSYYRSVDVFTLPSRESEAFGIVYLEALATNIPVVAPDDENRIKIIGNAGIFCNIENTKEYSKAIEKALNTNWANIPRREAEKFSWEKIAKKYEEIFLSY